MVIDSHVHISYVEQKKKFSEARDDLLSEMKKNHIDKSIVIPDNLHDSQCADLQTVIDLTKDNEKLAVIATLKVTETDQENIDRIEALYKSKAAVGFKIFPGYDPVYPTDKRREVSICGEGGIRTLEGIAPLAH